jgi:hypothetical protein
MKGIRMSAALLAAAAVASGAATAQAGGPVGGPSLVLSGTLSGYVKATKATPGSITISVAASSVPGAYVGSTVTLAVTRATKVHKHHKIEDGDPGSVVLQYGDAVLRPSLP